MDWVVVLRYVLLAVMICVPLLCVCHSKYHNSSMKPLLLDGNGSIRLGNHRQYQLLTKYSQSIDNYSTSSNHTLSTKSLMASYQILGDTDRKLTSLVSGSRDGYIDRMLVPQMTQYTRTPNNAMNETNSRPNPSHEDMTSASRGPPYSLNESDRAHHYSSALHNFFSATERTTIFALERILTDATDANIWKVVKRVGQLQPFFLFDQCGAASSAVRKAIHKACEHKHIPYFIPCFGSPEATGAFKYMLNSTEGNSRLLTNVKDERGRVNNASCESYSIPRKAGKVVHVFHMRWGEQNNLERFKGRSRSSFSCASNFREPLMRVQSCLYVKHSDVLKKLNVRCISELKVEQLLDLLVRRGIDDAGSTCLNEPFRSFSGVNDEEVLGRLGFSINPAGYINNSLTALDIDIFNFTMQHLLKCAPFIVDAPYRRNSLQLLRHKFPSLASQQLFDFEFSSTMDYGSLAGQIQRNTTWHHHHHLSRRFSASRSPSMEDAGKNIQDRHTDKAEKLRRKRSAFHKIDADDRRQLKRKALSYHSPASAPADKGIHCRNLVLPSEHATLLQRATALEKVLFDFVKFRINSTSQLLR